MPVEYRRALKEMKANADAEPKIAIGAVAEPSLRAQRSNLQRQANMDCFVARSSSQ